MFEIAISIHFLLTQSRVSLHNDTLRFVDECGGIVKVQKLKNGIEYFSDGKSSFRQFVWERALVPSGGQYYALQSQITQQAGNGTTKLISVFCYLDSKSNYIRVDSLIEGRNFLFHLCKISDRNCAVVQADENSRSPELFLISSAGEEEYIGGEGWFEIKAMALSDNGNYLIVNPRKVENDTLKDYLMYYNFKTGDSWEYNFDECIRCGRTPAQIEIDDDGYAYVEFEKTRMQFSKKGDIEFID